MKKGQGEKMRMKKNDCDDQGGNTYMPTLEARNTETHTMKKIMAVLVSLLFIVAFIPTIDADETVTGTFTPTGGSLSITVNNTSPAFGNINLGADASVTDINVTNDGTVNASITSIAVDGAGTWSLVAGTTAPATNDEYCVNWRVEAGAFVDLQTQKTLSSDLPPIGVNYTYYALKVFVSQYTTEGTPAQQTMYANLTVAAVS